MAELLAEANNPPINPVRISPLPPLAKAGVLSGTTQIEPSGLAIAVLAPLSKIILLLCFAACFTASKRSPLLTSISGNKRLNSPKWGVKTMLGPRVNCCDD